MCINSRHYLGAVAYLLLVTTSQLQAKAKDKDKHLQFGIFPYVTPGQMVKFHTPLVMEMEKVLATKVSLVTAPNFKEFIARTRQGKYDIIMTAPHLGRLAEEQGYKRVAHTIHEVQGIYLVHKDSPIKELADLKGKVITLVGRSAIITQMVEQQLTNLGLQVGKDVTFRLTRTHNNAMYAPLRGESDASVTGTLLLDKIGEKDRMNVRVIGKTPVAPGFMVMTGKNVTEQQRQNLTRALLNFENIPRGKAYLTRTGFKQFKPITDEEMKSLTPFIKIFLQTKK